MALEYLKEIYIKNKAIILYLFFGVCTMILNTAAYAVCYEIFGIGNVLSTIVAWLLAVVAAYITNKIWVFESRTDTASELMQEIWKFFSCRIVTGIADIAVMYIFVDILTWNATCMKIVANIIVVILNYVASKLWIFRKRKQIIEERA